MLHSVKQHNDCNCIENLSWLPQYRIHFDLAGEKHILKWTIRSLVKKEKQLFSEANENTLIDLIKIEVDPLFSLSVGTRLCCLHWILLQTTSTFIGISVGLFMLCNNLLHMNKGIKITLIIWSKAVYT